MVHRVWIPETGLKNLGMSHSYLIETSAGSNLRRNRSHLRSESKQSRDLF